jgi:hypothetical protein
VRPIHGLLFLLQELPVELIDELVDRNVEILFLGVGEELGAPKMHLCFGLLPILFEFKDDVDVDDLIRVPFEAGEFIVNVVSNGVGDVEMVTA